MNLDELRSVQSKERRKDSLQHLRDAFYDDVAAYVTDLRAARDRRADQVSNPFSDDDVRRMSDELETAEEVAEALYERRVGKVVKLASFAAADMPVETDGMTTQERALFDDLVERIETNKTAVLDVLTGEEQPTDAQSPAHADPDPRTAPAGEEPTPATDEEPTPATNDKPDSPTGDELDPATGSDSDSATRSEPTNPGTESNVLAGAMGTDSDTPQAVDEADRSADTAGEPIGNGDSERTPVDPEPAPPGAPSSTEASTESPPPADPVTDGSGSTAASPPSTNETGSSLNETGSTPNETESPNQTAERTPDADTNRQTVRITRDVGAILGVDDREYELTNEDVVALPAANVEPLVQRDAAERID